MAYYVINSEDSGFLKSAEGVYLDGFRHGADLMRAAILRKISMLMVSAETLDDIRYTVVGPNDSKD